MGPRLKRRARRIWPQDAVNKAHPLNQSRAAWWLCLPETMGGGTWYDLMGSNGGSLVSMDNVDNGWRPSTRPGGAGSMLFGGDGGYIACGTGIQPISTLAYALWVYPYASQPSAPYPILFGRDNGSASTCWGLALYGSSPPWGLYLIQTNGSNAYPAVSSVSPVPADEWSRIAVVADGSTYTAYLNGQPVAGTTTSYSGNFGAIATDTEIGARAGGTGTVSGLIDDATIWLANPLAIAEPAMFAALDYEQSLDGYPDALNWY